VLFFVGFMLADPLTLPPRRWQQLRLAAVVGLLFAIPYNLGFIANCPELALLAGNALAFAPASAAVSCSVSGAPAR